MNAKTLPEPTILNLVKPDSPLLRNETKRFDFSKPPMNPVELYRNLSNTMIKHEGVGLAAVQCGIPYSVFVIRSDPVMGFFNPEIVDTGEEEETMEEGCLTYPGLYFKVPRSKRIKIRFTEADGKTKTDKYIDFTARIIQHELDHINGILFPEMASRLQLEMAIKRAKKRGHDYSIKELL